MVAMVNYYIPDLIIFVCFLLYIHSNMSSVTDGIAATISSRRFDSEVKAIYKNKLVV